MAKKPNIKMGLSDYSSDAARVVGEQKAYTELDNQVRDVSYRINEIVSFINRNPNLPENLVLADEFLSKLFLAHELETRLCSLCYSVRQKQAKLYFSALQDKVVKPLQDKVVKPR